MNQAERKLRAVEERLEAVEAPAAPVGLLEAIQAEIPEELGAGASERPTRTWRLLAASLAMVAVGGVLGYRLLQDGPSPGDAVDTGRATEGSGEAGRHEEIGAAAETVETTPPEGTVGAVAAESHVAETPAPPRVAEPEVAAPVDETVTEHQARVVPIPDPTPDEPRELGELGSSSPQPAAEELIVVTSEAPLLDERNIGIGTTVDKLELEGIPTARDPWSALGQTPGVMVDRIQVGKQPARKLERTMEAPEALSIPKPAPSTGGTAEPNDQPYGDMFFQGYGTNPFVDTEDDAQSTFGLDVDTGSYTLTRSYLRRGHLPPADAVRVEEFVNFLDYGDPAPRRHDFAVVAEGAPSPFAATARTYLLRFALKGREVSAVDRKPAVLTFVVDVSGSMNRENRLELVKRALRLLVEQLDASDALGLVVYGSRGHVLLEPTSDHARVLAAIDRLQPEGSTNAEEGLRLGYDLARRHFRPGAINRLILCSDGVANVGATGPDSILARVAGEAEHGIELTTVGFGMGNYNDVLMEQLADQGDGNYAYVDDLEAARRVFVENLTGTLQTIAADAKVQVEFAPRLVQSYRLLGYENRDIADRDFRNDAVDAGEIGAGHQVTALYEVKLRDGAPSRGTLATLRLRYRSKASGQVVEDAVELDRRDLAGDWRGASRGLQTAAVAAEFAEILKGSYWVKDRSLDDLARRARDLARLGEWNSDAAELAELIGLAARLRAGGGAEGEDGIERD